MKEGDRNTKFFHYTANRRRSKNHISLLEIDRVELSDQGAISSAFSDFFRGLMGTTAPSHEIEVDWEQYYPVESQTPLYTLEEPFSEEEIRRAIFSRG